jgi:hypothetical protein
MEQMEIMQRKLLRQLFHKLFNWFEFVFFYYFLYPIYKCMIFLVTHCKLAHKDFIFHCSVVSYLEIMQRKLLRQLQCLSNQVANTAVYVPIGAVPIYMMIERNMLSLLMNIIRNNTTVEYKILS